MAHDSRTGLLLVPSRAAPDAEWQLVGIDARGATSATEVFRVGVGAGSTTQVSSVSVASSPSSSSSPVSPSSSTTSTAWVSMVDSAACLAQLPSPATTTSSCVSLVPVDLSTPSHTAGAPLVVVPAGVGSLVRASRAMMFADAAGNDGALLVVQHCSASTSQTNSNSTTALVAVLSLDNGTDTVVHSTPLDAHDHDHDRRQRHVEDGGGSGGNGEDARSAACARIHNTQIVEVGPASVAVAVGTRLIRLDWGK